jgi:hypothetical protein
MALELNVELVRQAAQASTVDTSQGEDKKADTPQDEGTEI